MSEFCLDCWNRINKTHDTEKEWVLSQEPDLCEGCGKYLPVIVTQRKGVAKLKFVWNQKKKNNILRK